MEKRPCTVPEPFQLATSARLGLNQLPGVQQQQQQQQEEGSRLFTAKPAPRAALAGPVGVPERKQLPVVGETVGSLLAIGISLSASLVFK